MDDHDQADQTDIVKRRGPDAKVWYVVAYAMGMAEAEISAGLLRSAGIPVFLFREAVGSAIPVSYGLMGGVEVAVPEAYYAEAMTLLEEENDSDEPPDRLLPGMDTE
ncbi:MAG: DUF2007 domain-containing protein [Anaerolineae bacterium]|nr:DUF2007 domain-containing protein [Anaerolineae bacterium]